MAISLPADCVAALKKAWQALGSRLLDIEHSNNIMPDKVTLPSSRV